MIHPCIPPFPSGVFQFDYWVYCHRDPRGYPRAGGITIWSKQWDSNPRPRDPRSRALPTTLCLDIRPSIPGDANPPTCAALHRAKGFFSVRHCIKAAPMEWHTGFEPAPPAWKTGMLTVKHQCHKRVMYLISV